MRVIAFNSPLIAIARHPCSRASPFRMLSCVVTQRSIELAHSLAWLGALDFTEQSRFDARDPAGGSGLLMLAASIAVLALGYASVAPRMINGLDGMEFDQFTDIGKFWTRPAQP